MDLKKQTQDAALREWKSNPALSEEFTSFDSYSAYRVATTTGLARIAPGVTVHHQRPGPTAFRTEAKQESSTHSDVQAAVEEFAKTCGPYGYIRTKLVSHVATRCGMTEAEASEAICTTVSPMH